MPRGVRVERPALLLALQDLGRQLLPRDVRRVLRELRAANGDDVGHERIEEPLFLGVAARRRIVAAELAQLLARLDAELDAAVPQHLAGLAVVQLCVHVERRKQRVERRRRAVHQERLVEALVVDEAPLPADVLVALVDLRRLREARALLVHGLRREQPGHLGLQVRKAHRAVVGEHRMERVVADPGLVPEHVVAEVPDLLEHLADVVDRAVVGRELDAREPERPLRLVPLLVLHERIRANLLAQILLVPRVPVDRADHAERIARRRQEHRNRARLDERALVQRLVVVAVEQHEVAAAQRRLSDDLVGGRRAVQHEVRPVGAEHLRGVLLRVDGGAHVNQQIAELDVGVAQIVAKDLLAEVLEEELAGRGFAVELPALMPGAGERHLCFGVVGHEPAEERRQQAHAVRDDARDDLLRVERRRLLAEVDVAVDFARHSEHGHVGDPARIRERPERRSETDVAHALARACARRRADRRRRPRCTRRLPSPPTRRGRSGR